MVNLNVSSDPCHVVDPVCMFSIHYVKQECCLSDPGSLNFKICLEQSLMGHLSVHTGALFLILLIHSFISSTCISRPIHSFIQPSLFINSIESFMHSFIIPLIFMFNFRTIYPFIHPSSQIHVHL